MKKKWGREINREKGEKWMGRAERVWAWFWKKQEEKEEKEGGLWAESMGF